MKAVDGEPRTSPTLNRVSGLVTMLGSVLWGADFIDFLDPVLLVLPPLFATVGRGRHARDLVAVDLVDRPLAGVRCGAPGNGHPRRLASGRRLATRSNAFSSFPLMRVRLPNYTQLVGTVRIELPVEGCLHPVLRSTPTSSASGFSTRPRPLPRRLEQRAQPFLRSGDCVPWMRVPATAVRRPLHPSRPEA
jgi:hypothetical protein